MNTCSYMKQLSIDGGLHTGNDEIFIQECINEVGFGYIALRMDQNIRKEIQDRPFGRTHLSFVEAYLRIAEHDLIIK